MKKLILIAVLVICVCFIISCGSEYNKDYVYDGESLIGKWQETDFDEKYYKIYEFNGDGTVTFSYFTYGISYGDSYSSRTQDYRVDGTNTLVLIEDFNGKNMESEFDFSINEDGRLVLHADDTDVNILEPYKLGYDDIDKSPVIGKWVDKTDKGTDLFWFLETGECMIFANIKGEIPDNVDDIDKAGFEFDLIQTMLYATNGDKIHILFSDEFMVSAENVGIAEYEINGDTLSIGSDELNVTLTRCK